MIAELLKPGRAEATSAAALMEILGLDDRRQLYELIERERCRGEVILSNRDRYGGGYYLPETKEELKEFIRGTEKACFTMQNTLTSARELLRSWERGAK